MAEQSGNEDEPTTTAEYQSLLDEVGQRRVERESAEVNQRDAEEAYLSRVAADYQSGELSFPDLCRAYLSFREVVGVNGHAKRWDEVIPVSGGTLVGRMRHAAKYRPRRNPKTGEEYWSGTWPRTLEDEGIPQNGQSVVYLLFDEEVQPCYIGSTSNFLQRMYAHVRDGKKFATWIAYPCADREAAFGREEELLALHMPYLNRRSVNGRGTVETTEPAKTVIPYDLPAPPPPRSHSRDEGSSALLVTTHAEPSPPAVSRG